MVFRQAMVLVLLGIALGLAGAFAGGGVMSNMLYGVAPNNPLLLTVACLVVMFTGALASYLPARRAASIEPMQALRSE
jgi:ABC-type antimicrobial peptide transport system permease subunit